MPKPELVTTVYTRNDVVEYEIVDGVVRIENVPSSQLPHSKPESVNTVREPGAIVYISKWADGWEETTTVFLPF